MKKNILSIALSLVVLVFAGACADAQVHTGGSNFTRMGVPPEGQVLERRGRSGEFGCNNPWVPGSQHACRRGPSHHAGPPQFNRMPPHYYSQQHHRGHRMHGNRMVVMPPVVTGPPPARPMVGPPAHLLPPEYLSQRAGATPPPSPEQVARMARHDTQYIPVPCAQGYTLNNEDGRCYRVRWVPGN